MNPKKQSMYYPKRAPCVSLTENIYLSDPSHSEPTPHIPSPHYTIPTKLTAPPLPLEFIVPATMTSNKPPPSHFNILYFASAASFTRKSSENFPAPVLVKELFDFLEGKYPGIKKSVLSSCAVTVNLEYVNIEEDVEMIIKEGDEVGIIPPVSSG